MDRLGAHRRFVGVFPHPKTATVAAEPAVAFFSSVGAFRGLSRIFLRLLSKFILPHSGTRKSHLCAPDPRCNTLWLPRPTHRRRSPIAPRSVLVFSAKLGTYEIDLPAPIILNCHFLNARASFGVKLVACPRELAPCFFFYRFSAQICAPGSIAFGSTIAKNLLQSHKSCSWVAQARD